MISTSPLSAARLCKDGKWTIVRYQPEMAAEYYETGRELLRERKWEEAMTFFRAITDSSEEAPEKLDAQFCVGLCYYRMHDFDFCANHMEAYLDQGGSKFFDKAVNYLYSCAEQWRHGHGRHLFASRRWPRWLPGHKEAELIYEKISTSYPGNPYAAESMISAGKLFTARKRFPEAISSYQGFLQRFPGHEQNADVYCLIAETYLAQAKLENHNPDILQLAELNLYRFSAAFPREERICILEDKIGEMREAFAEGMLETAEFYMTKGRTQAAALYYWRTKQRFQDTRVAEECDRQLQQMGSTLAELRLQGESAV
jgi:outer membrane assembly lipoprotein YfiO